jgi:hypothetical protein
MSARRHVAKGPESTCSKARILIPSRALVGFPLLTTFTSSKYSVQQFKGSKFNVGLELNATYTTSEPDIRVTPAEAVVQVTNFSFMLRSSKHSDEFLVLP